jgi:hypothetical protein
LFGISSFDINLLADPQVIQDINRALKLKARHEARLKAGHPAATVKRISISPSPQLNTPLYPIVASPPGTIGQTANASHIDFSPSTGSTPATRKHLLHPVPTSNDDGRTLDWSGLTSDDDKRWSLSTSKRKGKERETIIDVADVQKQEAIYHGKPIHSHTVACHLTLFSSKAATIIDNGLTTYPAES